MEWKKEGKSAHKNKPEETPAKNEEKNIDYLLTKAKKKPETYLPYLKYCETKEVSDAFADTLEKILQELLQVKEEEKIPDKLHNKVIFGYK